MNTYISVPETTTIFKPPHAALTHPRPFYLLPRHWLLWLLRRVARVTGDYVLLSLVLTIVAELRVIWGT